MRSDGPLVSQRAHGPAPNTRGSYCPSRVHRRMSARGLAPARVSPDFVSRRSPRLARKKVDIGSGHPLTPTKSRSLCKASSGIAVPLAEVSTRVSTTAPGVSFERIRIEAAVGGTPGDSSTIDEVFVVPGNPGVPGFYERFAQTLWRELNGAAAVEVIGYVGHTEQDVGTKHTKWFTLGEQVEHVTAEIVGSGGGETRQNSVVVGHSIGVEIALRAMKQHPSQITQVVGLMPFVLTNRKSVLQSFLSFLVRVRPLVLFVAGLVHVLKKIRPGFLRRVFTKGMDACATKNTLAWLRFGSVVNMALMGRTEFVELADPRGDGDDCGGVLKQHGDKVSFLYCEGTYCISQIPPP